MFKKFVRYVPLIITILGLLITFSISYFRLLENYELATLDLRYGLRPSQPMDPNIVVIEIGDDSIEKIGRWPFDREWHASLLNVLAYYGARAVLFDVIFSEEEAGDDALVASSKNIDVYYPFAFDLMEGVDKAPVASGYATPLLDKFTRVAKGTGHINTPPDIDGKIRRMPLFIRYEEALYPAVPFAMACDYLGISKQDIKVPLDEKSSMFINYPTGWKDSFRHLSYIDIIVSRYLESQGQEGEVDLGDLKGKVCFIGLTATGTYDVNTTPLGSLYPGVGTHASVFNTLVTGGFIRRAHRLVNVCITFILALFVVFVSFKFRPRISLCAVASSAILFIVAAFCLFACFRIWIDLFFPAILMISTYLYATFHRYTTERRKRILIEKELTIAKSIQESFLPEAIPKVEGLEIEAKMLTARHVGGDLYDFIDYEDGTLGVMIGDVSGKGVPAALFMAKAVSEFRLFSKSEKIPSKVLKDLNEQVVSTSKSNLFVTMSYLFFDMQSRKLTFASGGHLPLILARGQEVKALDVKEGLAIGLFESDFSNEGLDLLKGDLLLLYTDGVTEAVNKKNEEFGTERLTDIVKRYKDVSCKEIVDLIYNEIHSFAGKKPQHDDITVIAIRVLQQQPSQVSPATSS